MDYEDEQVTLTGGNLDGLFWKFVSLADSYFENYIKSNIKIGILEES